MAEMLAASLTAADSRGTPEYLGDESVDVLREGQEVPVTVGEGATLVMVEAALGRDRIIVNNGRYSLNGQDFKPLPAAPTAWLQLSTSANGKTSTRGH